MDAHTISIRTRTDTNQAYESLRRLLEFRNTSYPIFWSAMDKELYKYSFVKQAVQTLARKYGLDFNQFTNHSSYVCDEDLDNSFLQTLHYHEDGTKLTDCEDWVVILGF
uniref:Uncharacterized protein n=1 Tax=Ditylenchus dipsaci TaxID=166011 RepID=A0A915DHT0_9BILA